MAKIVIIGGGAAGLMAAVAAAEFAEKITVVEKNDRPARKLMITGKGRCNVTNHCDSATLIANTPRNGRFLYSAFSGFSSQDTELFFSTRGVPLKVERGNRVFPVSDKAADIVDALVGCAKRNAEMITGRAERILTENGAVSGVALRDGRILPADAVILATGGCSYPLTGSTGDGYEMAAALGHTVVPPVGSLVPLECHEGFCTKLAGLSLKNIMLTVSAAGRKKPVFCDRGELLFTHFGISGPLVLSASAHLTADGDYTAHIDLKPAILPEQLDRRILRDFEESGNRDFANALDGLLPKSLISVMVALSGIPAHTKVHAIDRESRLRLGRLLKDFTLHITRPRPVEEAVVTRGGVDVRQVNPATMQSKRVAGLYFAGEILDVDAYTGGFNLQIAFSTGFAAGKSAARGE